MKPFDAIDRLSQRQQNALPALLSNNTLKEAAAEAGIGERTLVRWLTQDDFKAGYRAARYIAMEEAFSVMQKSCTEAAMVIIEIMKSGTNDFVRLQAAQNVIGLANKSRTIEELEARIDALEQARDTSATTEAA